MVMEGGTSVVSVPCVDLSRPAAEVTRQVRAACEEVGFFMIVNHGVPDHLTRAAMRATRDFFDLPLEAKMKVASLKKGYIPVNGCDNAVRPTSLHEKFSCSRVDGVDLASDPSYYDPNGPNAELAGLYFGEENRWQG